MQGLMAPVARIKSGTFHAFTTLQIAPTTLA